MIFHFDVVMSVIQHIRRCCSQRNYIKHAIVRARALDKDDNYNGVLHICGIVAVSWPC